MKKVDFIPKTYIDEYMKKELYKDLNKHIINGLRYDEDWKGTFKPLEFLNLLYEQFEVLTTNMDKPYAILEHLLNLNLDKERLSFLLHYILKLMQEYFKSKKFKPIENQQLNDCYSILKEELLNIKVKDFPPSEERNQFMINYQDLLAEENPEKFFEEYPGLFQQNDSSSLSELEDWLFEGIVTKFNSEVSPQQQKNNDSSNGSENDCTLSTIEDLFNIDNKEIITQVVTILKQVEPPIITQNNKFNLGSKSKGSIVAWITALKTKGFIKKNISDKNIVSVLNNEFEGLNLGSDGRTLRNLDTTSYKKYYKDILNLLPSLPLSTDGKNR